MEDIIETQIFLLEVLYCPQCRLYRWWC